MYFSLAKMDKLYFSTVHEQEALKQIKEGGKLDLSDREAEEGYDLISWEIWTSRGEKKNTRSVRKR